MEGELGVKKPVTRLRRRLSVEQSEDVKSPSTPSTPTKRRGTRLATKPQLDLIDENIAVPSPLKVASKVSRDITDTPEGKVVTPSRRSTRTRSNTSDIEEKTLTPSRRSTRINKSASGTGAEPSQPVTTSRALRASRRNSQVGSDTETSATPGKKTRRKDSVSSIESQAEIVTINKFIDPDNSNVKGEIEIKQNLSSTETVNNNGGKTSNKNSKSPRLTTKNLSPDQHKFNESSNIMADKKSNHIDESELDLQITNILLPHDQSSLSDFTKLNNVSKSIVASNSGDEQLLPKKEDLDQKTENHKNNLKHLKVPDSVNNVRHRTRSWTTMSSVSVNEGAFFSDSENVKTKNKRTQRSLDPSDFLNNDGSGDTIIKSKTFEKFSEVQSKFQVEPKSKTNKKKKHSENIPISNNDNSSNESVTSFTEESANSVSNHENKENILDSGQNQETSVIQQLLAKASPKGMRSTVYFEDSDSNIDAGMKVKETHGDQRVPVVETSEIMCINELEDNSSHTEVNSSNISTGRAIIKNSLINDTCEPMDIDDTNIMNTSLEAGKENFAKNSCADVDSVKISEKENKQEMDIRNPREVDGKCNANTDSNTLNLSSKSTSQFLEKSNNENKSTLILTVKENSISEINTLKSPKSINNFLSKSNNAFETHDRLEIIKRNNSLNELSGTPVIQKKGTMQTSTPVISLKSDISMNEMNGKRNLRKDISFKDENKMKLKLLQEPENQIDEKNCSTKSKHMEKNTSKNRRDSVSSGESSSRGNDYFDDAADEASDDYESGDSRDEEEDRYEKEHEIIEKGETLTSEDEISDESDYEKDSFVVSSDAEDYELLSGSGDNLSMSDNELTMSKKSKKKYNDRKLKEQKKASKEMFESRHKLDDSNKSDDSVVIKSKKYNRQRLDSTLLESEDIVVTKSKKYTRMRLDSTQDTTALKSSPDISRHLKEKSELSQSICNSKMLNEKEMTMVCDESILNINDPLHLNVKKEPQTLQMNFEMSTVNFTVREEVEEIKLDGNKSVIMSNEVSDPLQSDDSCDSANEKFNQDYDSILQNLSKQTKPKTCNISLNLDQEPKAKELNPIVNQLNLTQTKNKKKVENIASERVVMDIDLNKSKESIKDNEPNLVTSKDSTKDKAEYKKINDDVPHLSNPKVLTKSTAVSNKTDDDSSDAIDFQLLFPEETSENEETQMRVIQRTDSDKVKTEDFIPLRKSEAETDIHKRMGDLSNKEKVKKNKRRLSDIEGNPIQAGSMKEKEHVRARKSLPAKIVTDDNVDIIAAAHKLASEKKKIVKEICPAVKQHEVDMNTSISKSASKKRNSKEDNSEKEQNQVVIDTSTNKSASKKRNSKENNTDKEQSPVDMNTSINKSAGKKKNSREDKSEKEQSHVDMNTSINKSASKKRNSKEDSCEKEQSLVDMNTSINKSASKRNNLREENYENKARQDDVNESVEKLSDIGRIDARRKLYEEEADDVNTTELNKSTGKKNTSINTKKHHEEKQQTVESNNSISKSVEKRKPVVEDNFNKDHEKNEGDIKGPASKSVDKKKKVATKKEWNQEKQNEGSKNKKRKRRPENEESEEHSTKVMKETYLHKVHVPRLPPVILNQLNDKPTKDSKRPVTIEKSDGDLQKPKAISTTDFLVEETKKRKLKPSNYLEESVYLNEEHTSPEAKRQKKHFKRPKVLPFMPTVSTSASGFTTNFKVNVIPNETKFVAQESNTNNFRNDYLYNKKIKRLGTYELYKRQMTNKLSKF